MASNASERLRKEATLGLTVGLGSNVGCLEGSDADFGVDLRRVQTGVTEELLDEADVGSVVVHVGRAAVAQEMTGTGLVDPSELHQALDPVAEVVRVQTGSVSADEERAFGEIDLEPGATLIQIADEPASGALSERYHPAFATLPLPNHHNAPREIQVLQIERF